MVFSPTSSTATQTCPASHSLCRSSNPLPPTSNNQDASVIGKGLGQIFIITSPVVVSSVPPQIFLLFLLVHFISFPHRCITRHLHDLVLRGQQVIFYTRRRHDIYFMTRIPATAKGISSWTFLGRYPPILCMGVFPLHIYHFILAMSLFIRFLKS